MKYDIANDFVLTQMFLSELGFTRTNVSGMVWYYDKLKVSLHIIEHSEYSNELGKYVRVPAIKLSLLWDEYSSGIREEIDVLITQDWKSIRQTILSSSITDLGIKPLNRSIKLYCLLNNIEYKQSSEGSISCMALKLNKELYLKFSK